MKISSTRQGEGNGMAYILCACSLTIVVLESAHAQSPRQEPSHALGVSGPQPAAMREKACILAAAQKLPYVPGTLIIASRAQASKNEVVVELEVRAAGVEATFGFNCRVALGGVPIAVPTGLLR